MVMANRHSGSRADHLRNRYSTAISIAALALAASCGGQTPAPETAAPAGDAADAAASPSGDEAGTDEMAPPDADAATTEGDMSADDTAAAAENPNETRDVVYKMVQGGLEVEVDGVLFRPKAEPVKVKGGAWGVKITMTAEGTGDSTRYLLKPKNGVLAFAGSIKRKGKLETFNDHRDGDETVELTPGASVSFESTWPKTGNALWWGDDLTLEAGLWGLGKTADMLRPVKQFFSLRMVAGNKPQPIIQPPKSAE